MPFSTVDLSSPVRYFGSTQGPLGSGSIWHDLPYNIAQPDVGFHWYTNFTDVPTPATTNAAANISEYSIFADTGGFARKPATGIADAHLEIGSDGDNELCTLIAGGSAKSYWTSTAKEAWFEVEFGSSTGATATKGGSFVGLISDVAAATDMPLTDADAIADYPVLGFHKLETSGNVDLVCKASGQTAQTLIATVGAFTGTTLQFKRFGLKLKPYNPIAKRVEVYVDGVKSATFITTTVMAAATFPNTVNLGFVACSNNAAGTSPYFTALRWARLAQRNLTY